MPAANNLKQIGLALHNYHDVYASFPPGIVTGVSDDLQLGTTGALAILLPFLEQANLRPMGRVAPVVRQPQFRDREDPRFHVLLSQ